MNKHKITVTVAGQTAVGKTTVVALLLEQLADLGCAVTVKGVDATDSMSAKVLHSRSILEGVEIEIVEVILARECS